MSKKNLIKPNNVSIAITLQSYGSVEANKIPWGYENILCKTKHQNGNGRNLTTSGFYMSETAHPY